MANEAKGFNEVNELIAMIEQIEEERDLLKLKIEELQKKEAGKATVQDLQHGRRRLLIR